MVITEFRSDLPDWVKENIMLRCVHCGSYICDNSDTGVTTARWCPNPSCIGHMAVKVVDICTHYGIKGIGEKTARDLCRMKGWTNPCQCIPYFFPNGKPEASLSDIVLFFNIDGYGETSAVQELSAYYCFEDYFLPTNYVNPLLLPWKDKLIEAQQYFALKRPMSKRKIHVMATGAFHGFSNRDEYFRKINTAFGEQVHVIVVGKRKNNVDFLIKEVDSADRSKATLAKQAKIPTVTPAQFFALIKRLCSYYDEE